MNVAHTERIELVVVGRGWIVDLVRDDDPRLPCIPEHLRDVGVARMESRPGVDHKEEQGRFADGLIHLAPDLELHWRARIVGDTSGIDEPEVLPCPIRARKMTVPSGTRLF